MTTTTDKLAEALRSAFELANRDAYGFRRSRRGNYTNPAIARDWKWFRMGAEAAQNLPSPEPLERDPLYVNTKPGDLGEEITEVGLLKSLPAGTP